ncbi:hypothetical protein ABF162_26155 (plasmid) [Vibrio coralliilyticus]|uniref:hypothetical protein n=1 Tax=Vibrio coralliilyticus TaxID=190893 RepID=UPI00345F13BA
MFNYIHPTTKKRKNSGRGVFPDMTLASAREKTVIFVSLPRMGDAPSLLRLKCVH